MTTAIIRQALETRLNTWADLESVPIAWENVDFEPPNGLHLRSNLLPAETSSIDMEGNHRGYTGVYQITVVAPRGSGPQAAETRLSDLAELFPVNLRITLSGVTVLVVAPVSSGPALQSDRYEIPVYFQYRAETI